LPPRQQVVWATPLLLPPSAFGLKPSAYLVAVTPGDEHSAIRRSLVGCLRKISHSHATEDGRERKKSDIKIPQSNAILILDPRILEPLSFLTIITPWVTFNSIEKIK